MLTEPLPSAMPTLSAVIQYGAAAVHITGDAITVTFRSGLLRPPQIIFAPLALGAFSLLVTGDLLEVDVAGLSRYGHDLVRGPRCHSTDVHIATRQECPEIYPGKGAGALTCLALYGWQACASEWVACGACGTPTRLPGTTALVTAPIQSQNQLSKPLGMRWECCVSRPAGGVTADGTSPLSGACSRVRGCLRATVLRPLSPPCLRSPSASNPYPNPSRNPAHCGAPQPELSLLGGAHPLPEVEVVLATLWTVASWRGVYAAYRAWANFF